MSIFGFKDYYKPLLIQLKHTMLFILLHSIFETQFLLPTLGFERRLNVTVNLTVLCLACYQNQEEKFWVRCYLNCKTNDKVAYIQEVKEKIRTVVGRYVAPLRNAKELKTALKELERIKMKLIPNIAVPCIATYNLEWVDALEATLMIDTAELTVNCSLFRTESRGHHFRLDHPETDDKNWLRCVSRRWQIATAMASAASFGCGTSASPSCSRTIS